MRWELLEGARGGGKAWLGGSYLGGCLRFGGAGLMLLEE